MTTIPTLQQLQSGFIASFEAQYGDKIPATGKCVLWVFSGVLAGMLKLLYLVLGNVQKNMAPDIADSESVGGTLERWGRIFLRRNPFPATAAKYTVQITGTIGQTINASTTFKSDDNSLNPGLLYVLDADYTLVNSADYITLRALTTGTAGALNIGDTLTCTQPLTLINSSVLVTAQVVQPLDAETIPEYRAAVLNSIRLITNGGSATDYRLWAQDAQGVAAVYPYANSLQSNSVNLFVESTIEDSIDGKGTPSTAMLNAVQSVIELNPDETLPVLERGRRPLSVIVNYLPISINTITITIAGISGATDAQKNAIQQALQAYINTIRPFVDGADVLANKNDTIDVYSIGGVITQAAPGLFPSGITLYVNSGSGPISVTSMQLINGNIPYLDPSTPTYV